MRKKLSAKEMAEHKEEHFGQAVGPLLKESVFGFNDGLVSTIALVAGLSGAVLETSIIAIAGLASMVAGAFSMGLGTYIGTKSEVDFYKSERERERWEIHNRRNNEVQEIYDIYRARGFKGKLLDDVVAQIIADEKVWLDVMMAEELGLPKEEGQDSPIKNGLVMASAFVVGAIIPLIPYIARFEGNPLTVALILSGAVLTTVGALKTRFTRKHVLKSALETLLIGIAATTAAYGAGLLLAGYGV